MRNITALVVGAVGIVCLSAEDALAWGPAVHVALADTVWSQLGVLPAAVAAILARHKIPFLYGSVAADVVFAKRLSRVKQFCHHWSTAFTVLDSAGDDRQRAFAYGYLSHLAADTVAHGKYVPRQIIVSHSPVNAGHLYWELRADAACDRGTHALVADVLKENHGDHHTLLAGHLGGTLLPYDLNRMLFDRMNAMTVRPAFRFGMDVWHRLTRYEFSADMLDGYRSECVDRIQSILTQGHRSPLTKEDPNGTSALMRVSVERRDAKRHRRNGGPTRHRHEEVARALAPATGSSFPAPSAFRSSKVQTAAIAGAISLHM